MTVSERIAARSMRFSSGCLEWTGARTKEGYGQIRIEGRTMLVHRVVYELEHGPPNGNVLHTCDNPSCHEPTHLYDGTQADNVRDAMERGRAFVPTSQHAGKTHCKHGHELAGDNVLEIRRRGGIERVCRACHRERQRRRRS